MRHYDYSAKVYDTQYSQEQNTKIKTVMDILPLKKGIILDAGCGTGLLFPYIEEKTKQIVGMDISAGILRKAKEKAYQCLKLALFRADADHMPFPDNFFDVAFAITLLQNMPTPQKTLAEIKRVSKRDAFIIATGLKKAFSKEEFTSLLLEAGLKVLVMKVDNQQKEHIALCTK
jgi:ubiquinone/menaquinone biosynthesis C-methylase UbiE